jgi:hypothetical protein
MLTTIIPQAAARGVLRVFDLLTAWLFRGDEEYVAKLRESDLFTQYEGTQS